MLTTTPMWNYFNLTKWTLDIYGTYSPIMYVNCFKCRFKIINKKSCFKVYEDSILVADYVVADNNFMSIIKNLNYDTTQKRKSV